MRVPDTFLFEKEIGESMKIALGADHAGVGCKDQIVEMLRGSGHEVEDMGTVSDTPVDYPDFALKVARAVEQNRVERGILVCGSGIGMSMAANRIKHVRAALCVDEKAAEVSRRHNDANVLCLGGRVQSWDDVSRIVKIWLRTTFDGGRHARRVAKIDGE